MPARRRRQAQAAVDVRLLWIGAANKDNSFGRAVMPARAGSSGTFSEKRSRSARDMAARSMRFDLAPLGVEPCPAANMASFADGLASGPPLI